MRKLFNISKYLMLFACIASAEAQEYIVKRTPFSSLLNDEFSPVPFRNGIVFCSNMKDNSLISYTDTQSRVFRLFYVEGNDSAGWNRPVLLSRELVSGFNDGPASFTGDGNTIYFSRNNYAGKNLGNLVDTANKLGIYTSQSDQLAWHGIRPFEYNNPLYTFCTPSISQDGRKLFFASDMPGGYGGMDLYYCTLDNEGWNAPVNLGPAINTPGNEAFPFAALFGKLYFASDGHKGLGKKDLFYTSDINGNWSAPVHMDSVINSPEDDFGLIMDSTFTKGYFSSRRNGNDDIFSFSMAPPVFTGCDTVRENNYCFTLFDEHYHTIDTIPVTYRWDFGNGITREGTEVKHCFPGPGSYTVKLTITDDLTGDTITRESVYNIELEDAEQACIKSPGAGIKGESIVFDGARLNFRDFTVTDYLWSFGDGFRQGSQVIETTFTRPGTYTVTLGLLGKTSTSEDVKKKCYMKNFRIYNSSKELEQQNLPYAGKSIPGRKILGIRIFFMDDITERQRSRIRSMLPSKDGYMLSFDPGGLTEPALLFLDQLAEVLKQNQRIRLEMAVHASGYGSARDCTELWASEISFFFRNRNLDVQCRGLGKSSESFRALKTYADRDGMVEMIFMEK